MKTRSLAEELRLIRKLRDVTLRDVEKVTEISNAYLSQLENGNATNPSPHILHKLANFYNVPYESLMKAAGYLQTSQLTTKTPKVPANIQAVLMSTKLSDEESEKVTEYIEFLRSLHKKQEK